MKVGLVAALLALAATAAGATSFDERKPQCLQCHGGNGVSPTKETPSLGGQPELYILTQAVAFRDGQRKAPPMNDMMAGFSDDDLRAATAFIVKLPAPPPLAETGEPARMQRGQQLAAQNRCVFCHGTDLAGHDQIPRLAHQREDYLLKALRDFKAQKRYGGGAMMNEVLYPLNDQDLADLAYYMAHLR